MFKTEVRPASWLERRLIPRLRELTSGRSQSGMNEVLNEVELNLSTDYVVLGRLDERLIGWAATVLYFQGKRASFHVFVDPEYRRRGYGTILATKALKATQKYEGEPLVKAFYQDEVVQKFHENILRKSVVRFQSRKSPRHWALNCS